MKFFATAFALSAVAAVSAAPAKPLVRRQVNSGLIPEFGHPQGLNPTGTGDCDGIRNPAGVVVKIPCFCPPDRGEFVASLNANVAAGRAVNNPGIAVSFPTGNSKEDKLTRMQAALVTLQNMRGPGVGCPAAATTFLAQQAAIQSGNDAPAPPPPPPAAPAPPPPPPQNNVGGNGGGVNPALVPEFGHPRGLNPTGTGDCDGIRNPAGVVVKIPCSCPPDRGEFLASLNRNVAAGRAVNNPGISIAFPTGNSREDKLARMHATLVTLQNLNGPGVGCPAAATTLLAQQAAI